ncbi:MAG: hypothetical protein OXG65_13560 [Chloroflexi bacterium]|nr:hypothetical protein [Chloroflexota bacterium]
MRHRSAPPSHLMLGWPFLPEDLPQRLERLKQTMGLSWEGVAMCLGVNVRQVQRWRRGTEPCGGALFALIRLANRVPGGLDLLLGDDAGRPSDR